MWTNSAMPGAQPIVPGSVLSPPPSIESAGRRSPGAAHPSLAV
jgi:hypothetical protein